MSTFLSTLGFGGLADGLPKRTAKDKGFTLVELLVVIAIISILATLLLLQLGIARSKARDAKRIADVNQVRSAVELYFDDNSAYPATWVLSLLKPTYLVNIPSDPIATGCTASTYNGVGAAGQAFNCYGYAWSPLAAPSKFQVWANLELNNKNALTNDADINSSGWTGTGANVDASVAGAEACTAATPKVCIYDQGTP